MDNAVPHAEKPPRLPPQFELVTLDPHRKRHGCGAGARSERRRRRHPRVVRGADERNDTSGKHVGCIPGQPALRADHRARLSERGVLAAHLRQCAGGGQRDRGDGLADDRPALRMAEPAAHQQPARGPGSTSRRPIPARDPYPALVLAASVNVAVHPPQPEPGGVQLHLRQWRARDYRRRRPGSVREPFPRLVEPLGRRRVRAAPPGMAYPGRWARLARADPTGGRTAAGPRGRHRRRRRARPRNRCRPAPRHNRGSTSDLRATPADRHDT